MKKILSMFVSACMLCAALFGGAAAQTYAAGSYEASVAGFGGPVRVRVTVDESALLSVEVLEHSETAGIGTNAIEQMPGRFVEAGGAGIDAVGGCTVTSTALKEAVQAALGEAMGIAQPAETALADGVYEAHVVSYSETYGLADGKGGMDLRVTVAEGRITGVDVLDYTDTLAIGGMAFPLLTEALVESQSLGIDVVSGATSSSNAYLAAVADCVKQAGGDVAAMKARPVEKRAPETSSVQTQILVVGAGIAGLSAAIEAASQGADVILLEKNEVLSSSTTRSVGFVVGADTDVQKAQGIYDTVDALYQDMYETYKGEPQLDADLLRKACYDSSDLIRFLEDGGVTFTGVKNVSPKGTRATMRTHMTDGAGAALSIALLDKAESLGVNVMMGTPATALLQRDDKTVYGCKATNKYGDDITIEAASVILCAGSYSNNPELFSELNPRINNVEYLCGSGDGDAYRFSKDAGADIVSVEYPQLMYYFYSPTWPVCPAVLPASPDNNVGDMLLVDGAGKRVTSEDDFCFEYVKEVWAGGYNEGYCVVGQAFADKYPETVATALGTTVSASGLPFGYHEDSVEQLAKDVGLDPEALAATVARYNELCDLGEDLDYSKAPEYLVKIEAPYYILRLPQIATDGYTGARINENAQVIDTEGNAIPGFYAAGSCAVGQMTSVNYFGCGSSLLIGGVYGRAAANHAVAALNR